MARSRKYFFFPFSKFDGLVIRDHLRIGLKFTYDVEMEIVKINPRKGGVTVTKVAEIDSRRNEPSIPWEEAKKTLGVT